MALVVIPVDHIYSISLSNLPTHFREREKIFRVLTFGYPMVRHRYHCSDRFSPPFMLSNGVSSFSPQKIIPESYIHRGEMKF